MIAPAAGAPDPPATAAPVAVTVTGKVVFNGTVSNAVVCVDRNQNTACDPDEPASARTGVDGMYSLTYTPADAAAEVEFAKAPFVAEIAPATSSTGGVVSSTGASADSSDPTGYLSLTAFRLGAPAGKPGQLNPLTTLLQAGIRSGLTPARAEAAVGLQLEIPVAEIYDYQQVPVDPSGGFADSSRSMALVTGSALTAGVPLRVVDTTVAAVAPPSDQLLNLDFTGPGQFFARTIPTDNVPDAAGKVRLTDTREGKTAGIATAENVLYNQAYLTSAGWVACNRSAPFTSTIGTPNRSSFCGTSGSINAGHTVETDIAGRTMASVVAEMQARPDNSVFGVVPSAAFPVGAVFPAGSRLRERKSVNLNQPYFINNTAPGTGDKTAFASFAALIAARQASNVALAPGTGTLGLGLYDTTHLLRFAFVGLTGDAVQYYSCESTPPNYPDIANCVPLGTGTFVIAPVNGVPVLELNGRPATTFGNTRAYAVYDDGSGAAVWQVRKVKPDLAFNSVSVVRLNGSAWAAMRTALGITP